MSLTYPHVTECYLQIHEIEAKTIQNIQQHSSIDLSTLDSLSLPEAVSFVLQYSTHVLSTDDYFKLSKSIMYIVEILNDPNITDLEREFLQLEHQRAMVIKMFYDNIFYDIMTGLNYIIEKHGFDAFAVQLYTQSKQMSSENNLFQFSNNDVQTFDSSTSFLPVEYLKTFDYGVISKLPPVQQFIIKFTLTMQGYTFISQQLQQSVHSLEPPTYNSGVVILNGIVSGINENTNPWFVESQYSSHMSGFLTDKFMKPVTFESSMIAFTSTVQNVFINTPLTLNTQHFDFTPFIEYTPVSNVIGTLKLPRPFPNTPPVSSVHTFPNTHNIPHLNGLSLHPPVSRVPKPFPNTPNIPVSRFSGFLQPSKPVQTTGPNIDYSTIDVSKLPFSYLPVISESTVDSNEPENTISPSNEDKILKVLNDRAAERQLKKNEEEAVKKQKERLDRLLKEETTRRLEEEAERLKKIQEQEKIDRLLDDKQKEDEKIYNFWIRFFAVVLFVITVGFMSVFYYIRRNRE